MPTSTYITLVIIYTLEAVLIVFGNAFPIFVFWTQRSPRANPIAAFMLVFSGTSVYFLALISIERAFAVLWPIRHRITNSRLYNCRIVIVWAVGLALFGYTLLSFHYSDFVGEYVFLTFRTFLLISFLIICVSYVRIRTRLRAPPRAELDNHRHQSREHSLRF